MTAHATVKTVVPSSELERNLAEEIARAMRRKPLMSRIDSVAPDATARTGAAARDDQVPEPEEAAHAPGLAPDRHLEDFDEPVTTPASTAKWLGKARRERNRARARHTVAWLATLVIGGTIISATFLLLPH